MRGACLEPPISLARAGIAFREVVRSASSGVRTFTVGTLCRWTRG
jgi:hypothetical protein